MKRFDIIEHTADVGIEAYGVELEEAFANAAYAMFTLIVDLDGVKEEVRRRIAVQAEDQESLLASWLNELLYLFDTEGIIFKRFEVTELGEKSLKAVGYGELIDTARHSLKTGIKAATYYMLRVAREDDKYSVRVIFDL